MFEDLKNLVTTTRGKDSPLPKPRTKNMEMILEKIAQNKNGEISTKSVNTYKALAYKGKHLRFTHHDFNVIFIPIVPLAGSLVISLIETRFYLSEKIKFYLYYRSKLDKTSDTAFFIPNPKKFNVEKQNFNNYFIMGSNDKNFASAILNNDVQDKLIYLENNNFRPIIRISKKRFTLMSHSWLTEKDYYEFIDTFLLILDRIRWSGYIESTIK